MDRTYVEIALSDFVADIIQVDVHSAPYTFIPSLLQKSIVRYTSAKMPSQYSTAYEFAANYLEMVKRRTPIVRPSSSILVLTTK
jgi:hypothetical protein